uniref:Lipoprotein n=1 Tax=Roseihalotalea indica TaxID=2867963 RepID=A0AA49JEZ6_9BACT|nr:hypothetical protein K4G66_21220 [Tunicatimonas sp. TK19036]
MRKFIWMGLWGVMVACQQEPDVIQRTIVNCDNCSTIVDSEQNNDWQVNRNELVCVDSTGIITGTIVMDGGKVCNVGRVSSPRVLINTGEFSNYDSLITDELIIDDRSAFFNYGYVQVNSRLIVNSEGALYQQGTIEVKGNFINNGEVSGLQDEGCYPIVVRGQSVNNSSGTITGNLDICDDSATTLDTSDGSIDASVTFCSCSP